jgi:hypothetical protein
MCKTHEYLLNILDKARNYKLQSLFIAAIRSHEGEQAVVCCGSRSRHQDHLVSRATTARVGSPTTCASACKVQAVYCTTEVGSVRRVGAWRVGEDRDGDVCQFFPPYFRTARTPRAPKLVHSISLSLSHVCGRFPRSKVQSTTGENGMEREILEKERNG